MPRAARVQEPGTIHHVTIRGSGGKDIFKTPADRRAFLGDLGSEVLRSDWTLLTYCFMSNHAHLLLRLGFKGIAEGMHQVVNAHAHRFNLLHDASGHLFGNRYHAAQIESAEHLVCALRYIVWNPCNAGLVSAPELWHWSAHRAQTFG